MKAKKIVFSIALLLSSVSMQASEDASTKSSALDGFPIVAQLQNLRPDHTAWKRFAPTAVLAAALHYKGKEIAELQGVNQVLGFVVDRTELTQEELFEGAEYLCGLHAVNAAWNFADNGVQNASAGAFLNVARKHFGADTGKNTLRNGMAAGLAVGLAHQYAPEGTKTLSSLGVSAALASK